MRTITTLLFVIIWFIHLVVGIGAGWATVRLWYSRHHPLIGRVGLYMNAFIVEVLVAIVLLFLARGVVLTWKFSTVLFLGTLLGDILRAPLILYLIKGPTRGPLLPEHAAASGDLPPQYWLDAFRLIVREEIEKSRPDPSAAILVNPPSND